MTNFTQYVYDFFHLQHVTNKNKKLDRSHNPAYLSFDISIAALHSLYHIQLLAYSAVMKIVILLEKILNKSKMK